MRIALSFLIASVILANAALADPPDGKGAGSKNRGAESRDGKGKGKDRDGTQATRADQSPRREKGADNDSARVQRSDKPAGVHRHFEDRHNTIIREYYTTQFRAGHCPPGLAKRNNGCLPPGQAKKWRMGQPLPRDVVYYDLPPALVVRIGAPPPGHRYVRVAADILLIAVGTGMVVDAIADLASM